MYIREFSEGMVDSAVQFHKQLNPLLWQGAVLNPQVRFKLLQIAKHFVNFIDIPELLLKDITISGSNAAYSYTQQSDLDLHLIVTLPPEREVLLKPLYDAKKNQYNFIHDIKIKGIDVEVYVQSEDQDHHSLGIYSVLDNKWITEPTMATVKINDGDVEAKVENYLNKIIQALTSDSIDTVKAVQQEIKKLRQSGLEQNGEFSIENVAFKVLRAKGFIGQLQQHLYKLQDQALSLGEQNMKINQVVSNQQGVVEMRNRRDAYQRDYDSSVSGMGKRQSQAYQDDGGANDESPELDPSEWYIVKDGKMFKVTVYPHQEQQAIEKGFSPSRDEAKAKANNEGMAEAEQSVAEGSAHGYNVVRWYRKNRNSSKITAWLKKEAGLPKETKLYFDDADLVLGSDTIVPEALVDDTLKFNDLLTALVKVTGGASKEKVDGVYRDQEVTEEETMGKVSQATAKDVTIDNPDGTKTIAPLARLTKDPQGNLSLGKPVAGTPGATPQPGQEQQDKIQAGQQIRISTEEDLNHISRLAGLAK